MPKLIAKTIRISAGSITKAQLLKQIKAELDKDFPTNVALTNHKITVTCNSKSPSPPKPEAK